MLSKASRVLGRLEDAVACLALVVVLFSVVWGISSRLLPVESAVWATELSGLAFTWVAFVGAAAAFRRGVHVSVPVLTEHLPIRARRVLSTVVQVLLAVFLCYALYLSAKLALQTFDRPSPVLRIPFVYVYAALVVGFFSMTVTSIRQLLGILFQSAGSSRDTSGDERER